MVLHSCKLAKNNEKKNYSVYLCFYEIVFVSFVSCYTYRKKFYIFRNALNWRVWWWRGICENS